MNARKLDGLEVTEVHVRLVDDPLHSKLKGFATILLNGWIVIRNLNLIQPDGGSDRMFVSFPSKVLKSGVRMDVVHPAGSEARAWIEEVVLDAYRAELRKDAGPARLREAV